MGTDFLYHNGTELSKGHTFWSNGFVFLVYKNKNIQRIFVRTSTIEGRKEGNVLFNDTLNTFYLRLYGVRHMVKDHSDSEKGNPLPPHRLLFTINKGSFTCTIPQTGQHIPRLLLHQSWSTGWNEKQLNGSAP